MQLSATTTHAFGITGLAIPDLWGTDVDLPCHGARGPLAPKRAINLARSSAAAANGGLRLYHPASCMFKNPTNNPCLAQQNANGFEFKFRGGPAGWEVLGLPATVESMVLVSPDGKSVIQELHQAIEAGSNEGELFN